MRLQVLLPGLFWLVDISKVTFWLTSVSCFFMGAFIAVLRATLAGGNVDKLAVVLTPREESFVAILGDWILRDDTLSWDSVNVSGLRMMVCGLQIHDNGLWHSVPWEFWLGALKICLKNFSFSTDSRGAADVSGLEWSDLWLWIGGEAFSSDAEVELVVLPYGDGVEEVMALFAEVMPITFPIGQVGLGGGF